MLKFFGIAIGSARKAESMERKLAYYHEKFLYHVGSTTLVPDFDVINYRILSTNGGKNWYALGEDDEIIGPVEEVYPGLLETNASLAVLIAYAEKHGPIDPAMAVGRHVLENAGFEVRQA